jgi:hypothetical protein
MDLKNQRTDEDDLSAAWIVINAERASGKFRGSRRRKFVTVQGRHFFVFATLGIWDKL